MAVPAPPGLARAVWGVNAWWAEVSALGVDGDGEVMGEVGLQLGIGVAARSVVCTLGRQLSRTTALQAHRVTAQDAHLVSGARARVAAWYETHIVSAASVVSLF